MKLMFSFIPKFPPVVMAITLLLLLARTLFMIFGPLDLAPDEAQYWDWSRNLQLSYVTKPPLVAWLIALSTSVFGDNYFGVRLFSILGQAAVGLLGYLIGKQVTGDKNGGLWGFALTTFAPLIAVGGLIMSPDVPCLTLWLASIYMLMKIEWRSKTSVPAPQWNKWLLIGVLIGLAGLAKPSAGMFYPLLFIFMAIKAPNWLVRPQFYVAGSISLLMQAPVLIWNMQNDWIMFRHMAGQASGDSRFNAGDSILDFFAGQAFALGPITLLGVIGGWLIFFRKPRCLNATMLQIFSGIIFLIFLANSLQGKVQANWPILGMVTGVYLLASAMPVAHRRVKSIVIAGLILNSTVALLLHDTFAIRNMGWKLSIKHDPTKPMLGWRGLGEQLQPFLDEFPHAKVLTTRYQATAGLAFHTPSQPQILYMNPGWRRENNYDLQTWPSLVGKQVIYVNEQGTLRPAVAEKFNNCRELAQLEAQRQGLMLRRAGVFLCEGWKDNLLATAGIIS